MNLTASLCTTLADQSYSLSDTQLLRELRMGESCEAITRRCELTAFSSSSSTLIVARPAKTARDSSIMSFPAAMSQKQQ